MTSEGYSNNYGKRPLWQWVVIYLVIAAFVYGLIYYFVLAKKGANPYSPTSSYQAPTQSATQSGAANLGNIYTTKTDQVKGAYMADFAGMTLYTFDKDTKGVSNCTGQCAALWPAYTSGATAQGNLPVNITVITRSDGGSQFAWEGMPLYYYANDKAPGDTLGDGVGGIWHLVKL